jgi:hypothetical protein
MCSNQLSYVAIFFRVTFIGVAGRIMRIELCSVNKFFAVFCLNAPVCLACNQADDLFGNFRSYPRQMQEKGATMGPLYA